MLNSEIKTKPQRETVIGQKDKGDKTKTEYGCIFDGYEVEPVIAYEYNADQMARCINELTPIMYSSMYYDAPDDLSHPSSDTKSTPLREVVNLFYHDRSQADREKILGQLSQQIKPDPKGWKKRKKAGSYKSKKIPMVLEVAKLTKYIAGQPDVKRLCEIASRYIADNLEAMMGGLYESLVVEVLDYSLRQLSREKGESNLEQPFEDTIKNLIGTYEKNLKKRLEACRPGGKKAQHDFSRFADYYDEYLPLWKQAKERYESTEIQKIKRLERFKKMEEEYPSLPPDLIKWLDNEEPAGQAHHKSCRM